MKTWILVPLAVLTLSGCGKKEEECATFLPAATKGFATVKAAASSAPATASAKERSTASIAVADAAEKFALDISKKAPTTTELQKASGDYQALCKVIAQAGRDDADALDLITAVQAKAKPDIADGDIKQLTADQAKVTKRCADKPATECKAIAKATASLGTISKDADALAKVESALGGIPVKDAGLGPLVTSLRGSITGLVKTLNDASDSVIELKSLEAKRATTKAALDAAIAKETPITAGITTFCAAK